ncbi:MAG: OadG family transporter subunit [Akkermansia sp.]|nr:OadG family transporter subunit [Akkermansia sp.]
MIAALTMDAVTYQVTGMCVVFCCLGFLCLILTASGAVAQRMEARRKARADAARAAITPAAPVPAAAAAGEPTPAQVAALAAGIYDTAASAITPEIVAVIAATVRYTLGHDARILDIKPVDSAYGQGGRNAVMNSHFPVRR